MSLHFHSPRAGSHTRSKRPGTLPKIPDHGPAAQLSQRVLLSKIQESSAGTEYMKPASWAVDASEGEKRKQKTLPFKTEKSGPQEGINFMNKLRTMLYQKDHLQASSHLDSVLVPSKDDDTAESKQPMQSNIESYDPSDPLWDISEPPTSHEASTKSFVSAKSVMSRQSVAASSQKSGFAGSRSSIRTARAARATQMELPLSLAPLEGLNGGLYTGTLLGHKRTQFAQSSGVGNLSNHSILARQECLRNAFQRTQKDIQNKIAEFEQHLSLEMEKGNIAAPITVESREGSKPSKNSPFAFHNPAKHLSNPKDIGLELQGVNAEKRTEPWMTAFFLAFERSSLQAIPPKPLVHANGLAKDEQGTPTSLATGDELSMCGCLLNLYRWLCGLKPVQQDPDCMKVCDIVSQTIMPRPPVFLKAGTPQFNQIMGFAEKTVEYLRDAGRVMVLHGEASLISAIGQCVSTCHTISEEESIRRPKRDFKECLADVQRRAELCRSRTPEPMMHASPGTFLFEKKRISLDDLPSQLEDLRILWEVSAEGDGTSHGADNNVEDTGGPASTAVVSSLFKPKQLVGPRPGTNRSNRSASGGAPKTRKVPWFNGRPLSERGMAEEHGQFWGDQDGTIDFRRYLLNPELKAFGACRRQDTCTFWTGSAMGEPPKKDVAPPEDPSKPVKKAEDPLSPKALNLRAKGLQSGASTPDDEEEWNPHSSMDKSDDFPEIVCFPPQGIFPLEYLFDTVPTWSVMPDCRYYQPTEKLEVGMWKVRIENNKAERLEEVRTLCLSTDCSHRGNPFCIIFRPDLARIEDGDCFEVHVKGLRSQQRAQEFFFFHQFMHFKAVDHDAHFTAEVKKIVKVIDNPILWQEPSACVPDNREKKEVVAKTAQAQHNVRDSSVSKSKHGTESQQKAKQGIDDKRKITKKQDFGSNLAMNKVSEEKSCRVAIKHDSSEIPVIGLISHPETTFQSETVDVTLAVYAPQVCAMRCHLFLTRVTSRDEIKRCSQVQRLGENFVIRVKLPMAHCRWELTFKVSTWKNPGYWIDHPLRYNIQSAENCQNLIFSSEHPLVNKFGFAMLQHTCQLYDVLIINPVNHRVRAGVAYFLIYMNPNCARHPKEVEPPPGEVLPPATQTLLFTERLAVDDPKQASSLKNTGEHHGTESSPRSRGSFTQRLSVQRNQAAMSKRASAHNVNTTGTEVGPTMDVITALNERLAEGIGHCVQDACGSVHVDLCIAENRQVQRLRQRNDFPGFYEALIEIPAGFIGCKVEMFLRFRKATPKVYAPIKLGEWLIIRRNEMFPNGF